MSRPVAYNTSFPLSGSITTQQGGGLISYTIDGEGRDYSSFAGKKWVPSADGAGPIIFVTDSFTQGYSTAANSVPLFYACNGTGSDAILFTANKLPGSPGNYTNVNDAITDLLSNDWFIIQRENPFQGEDADQLKVCLDAAKLISYPKTQSVAYDISGYNRAATLYNGVGWDSTSETFVLDGTNDYAQGSLNVAPTGKYALEIVGKFDNTTRSSYEYFGSLGDSAGPYTMISISKIGTQYPTSTYHGNLYCYVGTTQASITDVKLTGSGYYHVIMQALDDAPFIRAWVNGVEANFVQDEIPTQPVILTSTNYRISAWSAGTWYLDGNIASYKVYDKELTEDERNQNYFGSNIVYDSLVYALDANNIVSYPKSGTTWYNMTGSIGNGTLINGPTFDKDNGGSISFDGTNDYVNTNSTFSSYINASLPISFEVWVYVNLSDNDEMFFGSSWSTGGTTMRKTGTLYTANKVRFLLFTNGSNGGGLDSSVLTSPGWYHCVGTYNGGGLASPSNFKLYINGKSDGTSAQFGTPTSIPVTNNILLGQNGQAGSNAYFTGKMATMKVYNKELSAAEVLQNYQAQQYRFIEPDNIVTTNLTLWLDAGNLDSYSGTGTTWKDLSGNNNNATIKRASQWNDLGWFYYRGNTFDDESSAASVEINTTIGQGNTVEQWIYSEAQDGNGNMPFVWGNSGYDIWYYNNNFGINNGASLIYGISGANSILLNNWVHSVIYFPYDWAGSYTDAKMWINGVPQTMSIQQGSLANRSLSSPLTVYIGGGYTGGSDTFNWNGRVGQTRIYTRELTTAEVLQNYNATKGRYGL